MAESQPVVITEAASRRDRKAFMTFPMGLYQDCPCYVPPLIRDELEILSPKNPAWEVGQAKLFLARRDSQIVGRVAGILSGMANQKNNAKALRFGWFDAINDLAVARALLNAVEDWGRELGMDSLTGPQGFDTFDKAGMLVEGFDQLPTMATYYNHPYYNELMVQCGYQKEIDFDEYQLPL